MAAYKVLGTDHNAFAVSNMERSVKLFTELLGFEVTVDEEAEPELVGDLIGIPSRVRTVYVRGPDGHEVELVEWYGPEDRSTVASRPCDIGAAHMAIRVDDVPAARQAAIAAGLEPYNEIVTIEGEDGTTQSCYMRDPDGLTIEFLSRPGPHIRD